MIGTDYRKILREYVEDRRVAGTLNCISNKTPPLNPLVYFGALLAQNELQRLLNAVAQVVVRSTT